MKGFGGSKYKKGAGKDSKFETAEFSKLSGSGIAAGSVAAASLVTSGRSAASFGHKHQRMFKTASRNTRNTALNTGSSPRSPSCLLIV